MEQIGPAVFVTRSKNSACSLGLGHAGEFGRIGDVSFGFDPSEWKFYFVDESVHFIM